MKRFYATFFIIIILLLGLSACAKRSDDGIRAEQPDQTIKTDTEVENTITGPEDGYPAEGMVDAYPVSEDNQQESMYPIHDPSHEYGPSFTIDEPIDPNSNTVTGIGPVGVPIRLVDVTTMGEELASTTIDESGNFLFTLEQPLISGHAIGLMVGDLSETEFNYDEFVYSNEYIDKPMIGTLFYVAVVP